MEVDVDDGVVPASPTLNVKANILQHGRAMRQANLGDPTTLQGFVVLNSVSIHMSAAVSRCA